MDHHFESGAMDTLKKISNLWKDAENMKNQSKLFENMSDYTTFFLRRIESRDQSSRYNVPCIGRGDCKACRECVCKQKSVARERSDDGKIGTLQNRSPTDKDGGANGEEPVDRGCRSQGEESLKLGDIVRIDEGTVPMEDLIRVFDQDVVQSAKLQMTNPACFALIPSSGHLLYAVGQFIAAISSVSPSARFVYPGACDIEESVIKWVCEVVGYPDEARGVNVSGTSMGSLLAFATARHVKIRDNAQINRSVIYLTNSSHPCNTRALRIVGLTDVILRHVPTRDHRMDVGKLEEMIASDKRDGLSPFMVLATMGDTGLGAVDPLTDIGITAIKHDIWFHVDASYGGFFLMNQFVKSRYRGIHIADSITLDYHKTLSSQLGAATLLVRDGSHLRSSMSRESVPYILGPDIKYSPIDYGFEFTRPFRAFPVWFTLRVLGTGMIKTALNEKLSLAEYAYKSLNTMRNISTCMKPDLTVIAFRYSPPEEENGNDATIKLHHLITAEGKVCLTSTMVDSLYYIRMCILSFRSHIEDVEIALSSIQRNLDVMIKIKHSGCFGISS